MKNETTIIYLMWQHEHVTKQDNLLRWVRSEKYAKHLANSQDPGGPIWYEEYPISLEEIKAVREARLKANKKMQSYAGIKNAVNRLTKNLQEKVPAHIIRQELVLREKELLERLDVDHIYDDEIDFFIHLNVLGS